MCIRDRVLGVPFRWLDRLFTGKRKEIDEEEALAEPEIIQSGKERTDQNMFRDLCRSIDVYKRQGY